MKMKCSKKNKSVFVKITSSRCNFSSDRDLMLLWTGVRYTDSSISNERVRECVSK